MFHLYLTLVILTIFTVTFIPSLISTVNILLLLQVQLFNFDLIFNCDIITKSNKHVHVHVVDVIFVTKSKFSNCNGSMFMSSISRGGADQITTGREQVSLIFPDPRSSRKGRGSPGTLQRPRHTACAANSKHSHHDGNLRTCSLHVRTMAVKKHMTRVRLA